MPMAFLIGFTGLAGPPADPPGGPGAPAGEAASAGEFVAVLPQRPEPPELPTPPPERATDCGKTRCVALTFDDGPGEHTGALLDTLAAHRARATFFVLGGMVEQNGGEDLRRMVAEGHELGNHGWSHAALTGLSRAGIRSELRRTQEIVERETGVRMALMRPPYGATDGRVAAESRSQELAQILWSLDTMDWRDRDAAVVSRRAARATPGSIVLMHDIHPTTVKAVPKLLENLAGKDFTFVTLSELYGGAPSPGRRYSRR
ncbi:polysaccharide deacetylase family protein [Planobispora takensis]|nr:polysaccharide deacetylase family protein [Planobispora takensis]